MKIRNRIVFFSLLLLLFSDGIYAQRSKDLIDNSNAHKFIGGKEIILKKHKLTYVKEKGFKILAGFKNNPYQLDDSYKVMLILNRNIIYDGVFTDYGFETTIPLTQLNKKVAPRLIIYKKNKYYTFSCDEARKTITSKDNMIHIVFMPTNDSESMYFISTNWKLNEN